MGSDLNNSKGAAKGASNGGISSDRWGQVRLLMGFALGAIVTLTYQNATIAENDIRKLTEMREQTILAPSNSLEKMRRKRGRNTRRKTLESDQAASAVATAIKADEKKGEKPPEAPKSETEPLAEKSEAKDNSGTSAVSAASNTAAAGSPGSNLLAQAAAAAARKKKQSNGNGDPTVKLGVKYEELEALMKNETTRTAGQKFLDFAILGHAKCGTSTMMYWLAAHPEVATFEWEITVLQQKDPWDLIRRIFKGLPDGPYKRGYKSPNDVSNLRVVRLYREYFPKTKIMIGMRHPVKWFESFYNYRIQNGYNMPAAETLKAKCMGGQNNVCIDRARYHVNLAAFGKTPLTDDELNLFSKRSKRELLQDPHPFTPNDIYLYDTAQLGDKDPQRLAQFRTDLKEYIGLTDDLPPAMHVSPGHSVNATEQARRNANKIDICEEKFADQRQQLVVIGTEIRDWLQQYFLESPTVFVSNREHFDEIIETYTRDPCDVAMTKTE